MLYSRVCVFLNTMSFVYQYWTLNMCSTHFAHYLVCVCSMLTPEQMHQFLREIIQLPERSEFMRSELCALLVKLSFNEMDVDNDGRISIDDFEAWSRKNSFSGLIERTMESLHSMLFKSL